MSDLTYTSTLAVITTNLLHLSFCTIFSTMAVSPLSKTQEQETIRLGFHRITQEFSSSLHLQKILAPYFTV